MIDIKEYLNSRQLKRQVERSLARDLIGNRRNLDSMTVRSTNVLLPKEGYLKDCDSMELLASSLPFHI